ncbi:MAG: hypothetical protein H8E15_00780 [Planctomycetes bacterium]|nr:hypothetical protein [Planctomycetota bacterium]
MSSRFTALKLIKLNTLIACLFTCLSSALIAQGQEAQQLIQDLQRATDGYEVAKQSQAFADVRGAEAMQARVDIFDDKLEIKGGPNLRDWLVSGMIKAEGTEETKVLAKAAANKKSSPLLRLVCLRALRRGQANVDAKPLLGKSFQKCDAMTQREWQRSVGVLLAQNRLDLENVKGGAEAVRGQLLAAGAPYLGFQFLKNLTDSEAMQIAQSALKSKDPGDLAQMIHVLAAADTGEYAYFLKVARFALNNESAGPRIAVIEASTENQVFEVVPLIIQALQATQSEPPGRYPADYAAALRMLTQQQFGTRSQSWQTWWQRDGKNWLSGARSNGLKKPKLLNAKAEHQDGDDTVAQLFGIPVDSNRVAIVIDGSGSMKDDLDHRTAAQAAADELESFLADFPKDGRFQLHIIVREGKQCFKKVVQSNAKNCRQAVEFVRGFDYGAASSMYDVLVEAQEDPEIDTILFISDGGGSWGSFAYAGHMLDGLGFAHQRSGVRIHTICVGKSKPKLRFMRDLAELTGGKMKEPSG